MKHIITQEREKNKHGSEGAVLPCHGSSAVSAEKYVSGQAGSKENGMNFA